MNVYFADKKKRKKTFKRWPKGHIIQPDELVDAGCYYTGISDRVKCFSCGGVLYDWEAGDDPLQKHMLCYSDCSFAKDAYFGQQDQPSDATVAPSFEFLTDDARVTVQPVQEMLRPRDNLPTDQVILKSRKLKGTCKVCRKTRRMVVLLACNHKSLCVVCNRDRHQKRCPECGQTIMAFSEE